MKRYRTYSIYINHNLYTDAEREAELNRLDRDFYITKPPSGRIGYDPAAGRLENMISPQAKAYLAEQEEYRARHGDVYDWKGAIRAEEARVHGRYRDEIKELKATPASLKYERDVTRQLDIVRGTAIGNLLIDSIRSSVKLWIVYDQAKQGVASTTPGQLGADLGGGVRLNYTPTDFDPKMEYYTPDDILFHELVHAYRAAKGENYYKALPEYQTAEELLAVQMQNMYMAVRRKKRFYRSHSNAKLVTKQEAYEAIASDRETLDAFNYFLMHEPICKKAAAMSIPYNPWRDAAQINQMSPSPPKMYGLKMTF